MEAENIDLEIVTDGLAFPEGPVALPNGDVILVEIEAGRITRVSPDGTKTTVAEPGGGPNGLAMGPDGMLFLCNNGGLNFGRDADGHYFVDAALKRNSGGSIQKIDPETGSVETLYTECDGRPLCGPNDLIFDDAGGFWFTDCGLSYERVKDVTGVFYAKADGSEIHECIFPMDRPNGIGLSPDGTELYVAETHAGRAWAYELEAPGVIKSDTHPIKGKDGRLVVGLPGYQGFDSLGMDSEGNVCIATLFEGSITVASPDGKNIRQIPMPDSHTTNICFGGEDLRTAYITLSATGKLAKMTWHCPGMPLRYLNY